MWLKKSARISGNWDKKLCHSCQVNTESKKERSLDAEASELLIEVSHTTGHLDKCTAVPVEQQLFNTYALEFGFSKDILECLGFVPQEDANEQ